MEGDFDVLVDRVARNDDELISNDLVLRVALSPGRDPELADALDDLMLRRGRRVVAAILQHAVERGDIADRDWSLVADVLVAMGLLRVVGGQGVDSGFVRQVVDSLVLPAVRGAEPDVTTPDNGAN